MTDIADLRRDVEDAARYIDLLHNVGNTALVQGIPVTSFLDHQVRRAAKEDLASGRQPAVILFAVISYHQQYHSEPLVDPVAMYRSMLKNKEARDATARSLQ